MDTVDKDARTVQARACAIFPIGRTFGGIKSSERCPPPPKKKIKKRRMQKKKGRFCCLRQTEVSHRLVSSFTHQKSTSVNK